MLSIGIMHELSATVLHMQLMLGGKIDSDDAVTETATSEQKLDEAGSAAQNDQCMVGHLEDEVEDIRSLI